MGPCAKLVVTCTLVTPDGRRFIGRNDCATPQTTCPREPGEGYDKCKAVCGQDGHAEQVALRVAGDLAKGAHAYIEGHDHCCRMCQKDLFGAGVAALTVGAPPAAAYKTNIDGYDVELELGVSYDGGPPRSQCWISKQVRGRSHTASLAALEQEEELRCESSGMRDDYIHKVPSETIVKILDWAEQRGY